MRRGTFACELRDPPGRVPRSYPQGAPGPRRGPPNTDGLGKGNTEDCGVSEEAPSPASAVREVSVSLQASLAPQERELAVQRP